MIFWNGYSASLRTTTKIFSSASWNTACVPDFVRRSNVPCIQDHQGKKMAALEVVDEDSTTDIQILSRNIPSTIRGAGIYISSPGKENLQLSLPLGGTFSSYDAEVAAATSAFEHLPDLATNSHLLWCTDSQRVI